MGVRYWNTNWWNQTEILREAEDGSLTWVRARDGSFFDDALYPTINKYKLDHPGLYEVFPEWASDAPSQPSEEKDLSDVNIIREALDGQRGENQKKIAEVGVRIVATLLKKNKDYQGSAYQSPCLLQKLSPREGIQVRMSDKIQRLQNLLKGNTAEVKESVEDTVCDLSGYGILWLTAPEEAR